MEVKVIDVSSIAAAATSMAQAKTANAVQFAVLKMAMDVKAQGAMQLVQAASQVISNNPPNLGNRIDTFA